MILLDAYALLALLRDEPGADEVESMLRTNECGIVSINLAEVLDQLLRVAGVDPRLVSEVVAPMLSATVSVVAVGEDLAWRTAELRLRHYRKADSQLSLADCVLLAAAVSSDSIATGDKPLAAAARAEGVKVIDLPSG